jgi:hypothetical protein
MLRPEWVAAQIVAAMTTGQSFLPFVEPPTSRLGQRVPKS